MFLMTGEPPPSLQVGFTVVVLIVQLGLPVCPGKEQPEVTDDLLISVCVAAVKRAATEGRGQPEKQTVNLSEESGQK